MQKNNQQQNNNTSKDGYYAALTGFHRAVPIILTAVAVFIAICFITGGTGLAGEGLVAVLKGVFSYGAYAIPVMIILHSVFYAEDVAKKRILTRAIFSIITVLAVSAIEYTVCYWDSTIEFLPTLHYAEQTCGGFVGTVLGYGIIFVIGRVGLIILTVAILALYLAFFFANSESTFGKFTLAILTAVTNFFAMIERAIKGVFTKMKNSKAEKKQRELERNSDELLDDNFFDADNGMSELKIRELGISNKKDPATLESNIALQSKVHMKSEVDWYESEEDTVEPDVVITPAQISPAPRKRTVSFDHGIDVTPVSESSADKSKNRRDEYGIDASADSVFNSDFDPFDFEQAEKAAARASTKVPAAPRSGINHLTDNVSSLPTYEEYEAMKKAEAAELARKERLEAFERKKQLIIERQRAAGYGPIEEKSAPDTDTHAEEATQSIAVDTAAQITVKEEAPAGTPEATTYAAAPAFESTPVTVSTPTVESTPIVESAPIVEGAPAVESIPTEQLPEYERPLHLSYESEDIREIVKMVTQPQSARAEEAVEEVEEIVEENPDPIENHPDNETDEQIARRIAERIAMSNPGYARSANDLHTITTQVIMDDEPVGGAEAPAADVKTAQESSDAFEFIADGMEAEIKEYASTEDEGSVGEAVFKEFDAATDIARLDEESGGDSLVLERTMLSPTPESESSDTEEEEVAETSEDFAWVEKEEDGNTEATVSETEEGTVFTFGDGTVSSDDSEDIDDEDDTAEIFGTEPEDEDDAELTEIPPEEQNPDVIKQRELFPFLDQGSGDDEADEVYEEASSNGETAYEEDELTEEEPLEEAEDELPPFDNATSARTPDRTAVQPEPKPEPQAPAKPDYSNYEFPSIDFLGLDPEASDENVQLEIQENADRLIDTLASFNVTASIKGVDRGPRITRYEVVPAKGVKVSSIMNLQDDIALSLAADGIRMEAPIPGKSAVGVEIPNKKSSTVRLRELLETDEFVNTRSKTAICIGKDVAGQPVINDISKMPHLLIAGATGMGKSVCINSLLISILYKARPDEVKLIMIDPKQVEFTMYNGIPHLLIPVVSDAKQAAGALMWAVDEMERRYNLLNPLCVRNVDAYNEKVSQDPSLGEPMSKIIIVIDEFADLMLQVKDPVENLVMRIAQKARAAGIHLIIGTQRPSTNVITGTIKANIPSRISCKVASNVDSRTVLDAVGAEKLLNKGDMLFAYAGAIKPLRVQGAFVADSEVEAVMNHLKKFSNGATYDEAVMDEIKKAADKCSKKGSSAADSDEGGSESSGEGYLNDRQFLDAVDIAVSSGKLSTALLQRKLSIGYGKAARFIDVMCDMGIISEPNGQKPRDVLITADEWHEKLSRTMIDG